jgi:hypothetical protein
MPLRNVGGVIEAGERELVGQGVGDREGAEGRRERGARGHQREMRRKHPLVGLVRKRDTGPTTVRR